MFNGATTAMQLGQRMQNIGAAAPHPYFTEQRSCQLYQREGG